MTTNREKMELQALATTDVLVQKAIKRLELATKRNRWTDDARKEQVRVLKQKLDRISEDLDEIVMDSAMDATYIDDDHDEEALNAADALISEVYAKAGGSY